MTTPCLRMVAVAWSLHLAVRVEGPPAPGCRWDGRHFLDCSAVGIAALPPGSPHPIASPDASLRSIGAVPGPDGRDAWGLRRLRHLNLSSNLLAELTLSALSCSPWLETLDLSANRLRSISVGRRRNPPWAGPLPALRQLSIRRNRLSAVPGELWRLRLLRHLDLSFNSIARVGPRDFRDCVCLESLDLQSNRLTTIHHEAFKELSNLQRVDLAHNALTSILPPLQLGLRLPHLDVDLSGNPWLCDCNLTVLQGFLSASWRDSWGVTCGRGCQMAEPVTRKVLVPGRAEIVLDCGSDPPQGADGPFWWTPYGPISRDSRIPHLRLNEQQQIVLEASEAVRLGLYACFSPGGGKKPVIYRVSRKPPPSPGLVRNPRGLPAVLREPGSAPNLPLAVGLAVAVTFVLAFGLGAFTRPYMDRLWRRRRRRGPSPGSGAKIAFSNHGFSGDTGSPPETATPASRRRVSPEAVGGEEEREPPSPSPLGPSSKSIRAGDGSFYENSFQGPASALAPVLLQGDRPSPGPATLPLYEELEGPRGEQPDSPGEPSSVILRSQISDRPEIATPSDSDSGSLFTLSSGGFEEWSNTEDVEAGEEGVAGPSPPPTPQSRGAQGGEGWERAVATEADLPPGYQGQMEQPPVQAGGSSPGDRASGLWTLDQPRRGSPAPSGQAPAVPVETREPVWDRSPPGRSSGWPTSVLTSDSEETPGTSAHYARVPLVASSPSWPPMPIAGGSELQESGPRSFRQRRYGRPAGRGRAGSAPAGPRSRRSPFNGVAPPTSSRQRNRDRPSLARGPRWRGGHTFTTRAAKGRRWTLVRLSCLI
ncbi:leucine-rich repeat-containing protein 66 [Tachyglossus aculeatus]|uniref:leucine-rich repeat-containing protein 66 n=1 Tax=Tachyglossus aculeatus TaxID=9261 RepID=UPI0018F6D485|nr:leucine-rich repeat-containing protein 66 [Tachyglossus aculeatus]XP_038625067.1 leucine-rich repeat-containing protein 66 [Tachyglossus aculeatus]